MNPQSDLPPTTCALNQRLKPAPTTFTWVTVPRACAHGLCSEPAPWPCAHNLYSGVVNQIQHSKAGVRVLGYKPTHSLKPLTLRPVATSFACIQCIDLEVV